jgi:hypothetical protein
MEECNNSLIHGVKNGSRKRTTFAAKIKNSN